MCQCTETGYIRCDCDRAARRKEVREMSRSELDTYQSAIRYLSQTKGGQPSPWFQFAQLYADHKPQVQETSMCGYVSICFICFYYHQYDLLPHFASHMKLHLLRKHLFLGKGCRYWVKIWAGQWNSHVYLPFSYGLVDFPCLSLFSYRLVDIPCLSPFLLQASGYPMFVSLSFTGQWISYICLPFS